MIRAIPRGQFSCFWRPIRERLGRSDCLTSRAAPAQVSEDFFDQIALPRWGRRRSVSRCAAVM